MDYSQSAVEFPIASPSRISLDTASTDLGSSKESAWRAAYEKARMAVETVDESSDMFSLLKAVVSVFSVLINNYDQTTANLERVRAIEERVESLDEVLTCPLSRGDGGELERRGSLARKLAEIISKLQPLSEERGLVKFFVGADYKDTLDGFVQDLTRAITDFEASTQHLFHETSERVDDDRTRVTIVDNRDPEKQLRQGYKGLSHRNIVPLQDVATETKILVLREDLTEYILNHPDVDRLMLLSDIAEGLNYLHSRDVIHGNLKGSNVLIDDTGCAQLRVGFGTTGDQGIAPLRGASVQRGDSLRWMAPEVSDGGGNHSKEADVFAFAMVVIEAFAGAVPFNDRPNHEAMLAIVGGERPLRPNNHSFTDVLWAFVQQCWEQDATKRPQAAEVSRVFKVPAWKRLTHRPTTTDECISLITTILSDRSVRRRPKASSDRFRPIREADLAGRRTTR